MEQFQPMRAGFEAQNRPKRANVKHSRKYEHFGETIRYLTCEEWQNFSDSIDKYEHKLMMRMIYELGCRVGEFVRIRLEHIDFRQGRVFLPKESTKTGRRRVSHLPQGLVNELKSWLKASGRITVREERIKKPEQYLFSASRNFKYPYSENRLRQIFQHYAKKAGINREYGLDTKGRTLHQLTIHSLRHSHIMHYIHLHKLPIAVVQKQVGHTSLKTTSFYLNPSDEDVGEAYREVRRKVVSHHNNS